MVEEVRDNLKESVVTLLVAVIGDGSGQVGLAAARRTSKY
jgi:hypothetical protein